MIVNNLKKFLFWFGVGGLAGSAIFYRDPMLASSLAVMLVGLFLPVRS